MKHHGHVCVQCVTLTSINRLYALLYPTDIISPYRVTPLREIWLSGIEECPHGETSQGAFRLPDQTSDFASADLAPRRHILDYLWGGHSNLQNPFHIGL